MDQIRLGSTGLQRVPRLPRDDELRQRHRAPVGARRGRRPSRSSAAPSRAASRSSTPPTCTRAAPARSPPAGCCRSTSRATRSSSRPRSSADDARRRTAAGCRASTSCRRIDASLERLGMDYVDLYQIHRWDPHTPIEETMEALHDVVRAGKARYIGASSMYAWQFAKAQHVADANGWTRFVSMQNHYNLRLPRGGARDDPAVPRPGRRRHPVEPAGARLARRQPHAATGERRTDPRGDRRVRATRSTAATTTSTSSTASPRSPPSAACPPRRSRSRGCCTSPA